ncbi:MAG: YncE family protein [Pseudomonadota bacterium]|nr:YncE family protein [Pseudomonadota bacterium]
MRALIVLALVAAAPGSPPQPNFFQLRSATLLPGKAPEYDYLTYDAARKYLVMGRRHDGVFVYDTVARRLVRKIAQSEGANAAILVPGVGRGFSTNEDGSTTVFSLPGYATIKRLKFADDADAAIFDPASGQVAFLSGDSKKITLIDARTLAVTGTIPMASNKLEGSAADGHGGIFVAERDRAMLAHIDLRSKTVSAEWPTTGCLQPTGLAYDAGHRRVLLGCRGAAPVLTVLDGDNGRVVATQTIGRGNDGVAYDAVHNRVFTSNGVDSNLVIFHQDDPDHYRLEQALTTRPGARTLAFDPVGERVFTVAAEGIVDPSRPINTGPSAFYPNRFTDDSFTVLEIAVRPSR